MLKIKENKTMLGFQNNKLRNIISKMNENLQADERKNETVTHIKVKEPKAKYMIESMRALQLLLEQDRQFYYGVLPHEELSMLKEYIKRAPDEEVEELLNKEKKLELDIRVNRQLVPRVPEDKMNLVQSNFDKEYKLLEESINSNTDDLNSVEEQIKSLVKQKDLLLEQRSEMQNEQRIAQGMKLFLNNPDSVEDWRTDVVGHFDSEKRVGKSWLRFRIGVFGGSLSQYITDQKALYYKEKYNLYSTNQHINNKNNELIKNY